MRAVLDGHCSHTPHNRSVAEGQDDVLLQLMPWQVGEIFSPASARDTEATDAVGLSGACRPGSDFDRGHSCHDACIHLIRLRTAMR